MPLAWCGLLPGRPKGQNLDAVESFPSHKFGQGKGDWGFALMLNGISMTTPLHSDNFLAHHPAYR